MKEELSNRIGEKVTVALDQIGPLSDEVIRQYAARQLRLGWICVAVAASTLIICALLFVSAVRTSDEDCCWMAGIAGLILLALDIAFGVTACTHFLNAANPLPALLGL